MIVDRSEVFSKTHACFVWVSGVFPKSSFSQNKESAEGETKRCVSECMQSEDEWHQRIKRSWCRKKEICFKDNHWIVLYNISTRYLKTQAEQVIHQHRGEMGMWPLTSVIGSKSLHFLWRQKCQCWVQVTSEDEWECVCLRYIYKYVVHRLHVYMFQTCWIKPIINQIIYSGWIEKGPLIFNCNFYLVFFASTLASPEGSNCELYTVHVFPKRPSSIVTQTAVFEPS